MDLFYSVKSIFLLRTNRHKLVHSNSLGLIVVLIRISIDLGSVLSLITCIFSPCQPSLVILYPEMCSNSVVPTNYKAVIRANFTVIFQITMCSRQL